MAWSFWLEHSLSGSPSWRTFAMNMISLRAFTKSAEVCTETISAANLWEIFHRDRCDGVVVLNANRHPLGWISLQRFVSVFFSDARLSTTREPAAALPDPIVPALIEPIHHLTEQWDEQNLQHHLRSLSAQPWVLVNEQGEYVGVLDALKLWQYLAECPPESATHHFPMELLSFSATDDRTRSPQIQVALLQLLEQLPLPMMLQTSGGSVLHQNRVWQQQVGDLKDPVALRQKAALLLAQNTLETSPPAVAQGRSHSPSATLGSFTPLSGDRSIELNASVLPLATAQWSIAAQSRNHAKNHAKNQARNQAGNPSKSTTVCHPGRETNSCICICPTQSGQEKVWQLVKIPLGSLSARKLAELNRAIAADPISSEFQRAGLRNQFDELSHGVHAAEETDQGGDRLPLSEDLWLVMAQDQTEQQLVARELTAKNADLLHLNRLKDEFLACISHELKTPLTAVLGLSNLLKDQQLGPLNERQERYARLIYQSGRHLILIVNDILDLTRIETGQLELTLEDVVVESVCHRAYEQAVQLQSAEDTLEFSTDDKTATRSPTAFQLDIQPNLAPLVADELRLRQMLANLLSNAMKFTLPGGEFGLRVEQWEGWIAFTVWDTGIGIPIDKQHLIFQKFQQLENPMTRRFDGTGLGLVLTQRLARLHGGDVTFISSEGKGSQFTILLPPTPPEHHLAPGVLSNFQPKTIATRSHRLVLVVESVSHSLDHLIQPLREMGYWAAIARSGPEAVEKARRLQPAIVLLNPMLPTLSGWDVLTLIKSAKETQQIPIVVMATQAERSQAIELGADGFLPQPISSTVLQNLLARLVEQPTEPSAEPLTKLTVLYLNLSSNTPLAASSQRSPLPLSVDLTELLQPYDCRVLEVDDLDQADLLARVWKPHVLLLNGNIPHPPSFLKHLSHFQFLSALPLVTMAQEITQIANQVPGLSVFPCLDPLRVCRITGNPVQEIPALFRVLQVAAGVDWTPRLLIIDLATLSNLSESPDASASLTGNNPTAAKSEFCSLESHLMPNWLQAFQQYVKSAGFSSLLVTDWTEVMQHLQYQSVDMILICLRQTVPTPKTRQYLESIATFEPKPPIVVWDCQSAETSLSPDAQALRTQLWAIATRILPASLSMQGLLDQVQQLL